MSKNKQPADGRQAAKRATETKQPAKRGQAAKRATETNQPAKRPTVTITLFDLAGSAVRHWALGQAQPVKWTGPDGKAGGSGAATESLEISHIGFV